MTGKRERPLCRAWRTTVVHGSAASTATIRTRGVMISPAVRSENATERCMSAAVAVSRVPWLAERPTSDTSSSGVRAERSSSCGSTPSRRTSALAEPLSSVIGPAIAAVKNRIGAWVARAVPSGRAIARFFGTSSPKTIVTRVASTMPSATAMPGTDDDGRPAEVRAGSMSEAMAGSARKPIARLVSVIPTWAPDSCVESERQRPLRPLGSAVAGRTPPCRRHCGRR